MLHLKIGEQRIALDGALVADIMLDSMPDFLKPGYPAAGMREKAVKSALQGVLPIILGMIGDKIADAGANIPAPDLRSPDAKRDMIGFAVSYLLSVGIANLDANIYELVGVPNSDGETVITGLHAAAPALVGGSASGDCGCASAAGVPATGENSEQRD